MWTPKICHRSFDCGLTLVSKNKELLIYSLGFGGLSFAELSSSQLPNNYIAELKTGARGVLAAGLTGAV